MNLKEVLQMIDELRARHIKKIDEQLASYAPFSILKTADYNQGAVDVLEELRDAIKQEGGDE